MSIPQNQPDNNPFSSSPAFGTPLHPLPNNNNNNNNNQRLPPPPAFKPQLSTILPILLPAPTLQPVAYRVFTKKHGLALPPSAVQSFASFVGRHCGSGWRDEGTGEKVLEEVARIWKAENGPVIVEDGEKLKAILRTLEGCMSGGRIGTRKGPGSFGRQTSFAFGHDGAVGRSDRPSLERHASGSAASGPGAQSPAAAAAAAAQDAEPEGSRRDARSWFKVTSAFEQPRFAYSVDKKHFLRLENTPSLFPSAKQKTAVVKERYNVIHQRLLRNPAFQAPSFSAQASALRRSNTVTERSFYKVTPIANLLGRGGTSHMILGMLVTAPTGTLALNDVSGSISLDLQHATSMQEIQPYFCPGMIVLVDGVYEEDWAGVGSSGLGNTGGVGGTIGGRFVAFEIGGPPVEKRDISLGINVRADEVDGGFGWTDFLGQGSERAVGQRMRRLEQRLLGPESGVEEGGRKMVVLSDLTLDRPTTLAALRRVLERYENAHQPPMTFVVCGDFSSKAAMAGAGTGSIEYKELFNELAAVLGDFPGLLRSCTWIFVPGDNDPWASSFSAGASTILPREGVPALFTSRVKRAFANAKQETAGKKPDVEGEAIWTTNPTRLSLFGPAHEVVVFRDDISGRMRRNAIRYGQAIRQQESQGDRDTEVAARDASEHVAMSGALPSTEHHTAGDLGMTGAMPIEEAPAPLDVSAERYATQEAKRLILSLLPQSTLSPFPLTVRPAHWDYAPSALSLYPLPHSLVLADAEAPAFALTYEGCHVMNPGRLVEGGGRRKKVQWIEYDALTKRGSVQEVWMG